MLKQALEYLVGLGKTEIKEIDGFKYATNKCQKIDDPIVDEYFQLTTLTGVIDYVKNGIDGDIVGKDLTIHIKSPSIVKIYSKLNKDRNREQLVEAEAILPRIDFNYFMDTERFNIMLQSCFEHSVDLKTMLKIVGNIQEEVVKNTGDDGITQTVTARSGIARVADVELPNPVELAPYRTFPELQQPYSKFVLRMQRGPEAALFEAGGTGWRVNAMEGIKQYLSEALEDCNVKIIL
ncbi:hypothetical protein SH1V18_15200 [Vallitalea longa]|uniref:Uncharacterized protein n=1 Tax=Vallitalea longa TaxID=2936439 RepID=A0A9W6DE30_9FIRM|nr:hypothetical protein [Vallitalea longa]GKX29040.1 hypothetical protein SH1V18_15200 [Vallitalea longa]